MHSRFKKYLLISIGCLSVILGIIGAVLPLLPTTPFLILALACFSKSSPRFHQMLLDNRWVGEPLRQWEKNRTISHASKVKATIAVTITFAISIAVLHGRTYLQLGLLTMLTVALIVMWRIKDDEPFSLFKKNKDKNR